MPLWWIFTFYWGFNRLEEMGGSHNEAWTVLRPVNVFPFRPPLRLLSGVPLSVKQIFLSNTCLGKFNCCNHSRFCFHVFTLDDNKRPKLSAFPFETNFFSVILSSIEVKTDKRLSSDVGGGLNCSNLIRVKCGNRNVFKSFRILYRKLIIQISHSKEENLIFFAVLPASESEIFFITRPFQVLSQLPISFILGLLYIL